ncbi:MAG TPA: hypothetical protein VMV76_03360 [Dehalococcoidia bacterium]|nr:hypothetical protein [Dehalococcoidia bacterium]
MVTPTLTLTYPDLQSGKVRLLAITHDKRVLTVFKKVVLEEAHLNLLGCQDNILHIEYEEELHKLEKLLNALVPDRPEVDSG